MSFAVILDSRLVECVGCRLTRPLPPSARAQLEALKAFGAEHEGCVRSEPLYPYSKAPRLPNEVES